MHQKGNLNEQKDSRSSMRQRIQTILLPLSLTVPFSNQTHKGLLVPRVSDALTHTLGANKVTFVLF